MACEYSKSIVLPDKRLLLLLQPIRMMIVGRMLLLLMLIVIVKSDPLLHSSCETACICESNSVVCKGRQLDNIPNDLNPYITRLDVGRNKIKYVSNMEAYSRYIGFVRNCLHHSLKLHTLCGLNIHCLLFRLEYLDLSENEIVEIKPHCFRESSEMLTLNLRQNRIGTVDHNDLEGLTHLVTLNMAENSIDNITDRAFIWLQGLQSISLANNRLDGLHPGTFQGSVRNTLRGLDLSNNLFRSIPREALAGLVDLTRLDFSENPLGKLDSGEFQRIGGKLSELKLSGCQLHHVGAIAFYGLESLKKLDLSNNGLTETPNRAFNNLGMLEELKIGRNKIKTFGRQDFLSLKNMKHFSIEGCNGGSLTLNDGIFAENTNLESILIKCPDLKTISDQVSLIHLSVLKSLSFHGSGLENIPEHLVNYYDIAELDLSSNPLHCDCQLKFLFNLLVQPSPLQLSGICSSPAKLANTDLLRLREKVGKLSDLNSVSIQTLKMFLLVILRLTQNKTHKSPLVPLNPVFFYSSSSLITPMTLSWPKNFRSQSQACLKNILLQVAKTVEHTFKN